EPAFGRAGALLLLAGMGGPDAVRRVLAALPAHFDRPVLVLLRLDGGRYDNLVKQMQRASALPTLLARADTRARGGYVYVVPADVAAAVSEGGGIAFAAGGTDLAALFGTLAPADAALLMLSGADPALAEAALMLAARGALVAAQDPAGCYDPAAARALVAAGIESAAPESLVARVADHLTA
ncbi:MAG: chemotaxis protein CheB, partial [Pseudoxanthomonas sp.]